MAVQDAIIIGGVMAVFAALGTVAYIADRRRKQQITALLGSLGLESSFADPTLSASEAFTRAGPMTRLRKGADGVRWHASGEIDGLAITLLEHRYMVSSGKSRRAVYHTIAATPCPPSWPTLSVTGEHLFDKIAEFFGSKDIKVEDPEFNSRWRVKCAREDFAILVLTPEVQRFLTGLTDGTWLEIGEGAICLVRRSQVNGDGAGRLIQSTLALARLLPPELEAWQG